MSSKRLIKELEQYNKDPSPAVSRLEPVGDDLTQLTAVLVGPAGTAYESMNDFCLFPTRWTEICYYPETNLILLSVPDGHWNLSISVPPSYPNAPPTIHFTTPICHPNIAFQTGEICLDLLKTSWTPAYGIVSTLEAVQQLLSAGGEPDSPLNLDIAKLIRQGDLVGAEGLIRFYTGLYAMGR